MATGRRTTTKRRTGAKRRTPARYWSAGVTQRSNALDLDAGVFTWSDPHRIALSLRRAARRSGRRKGTPYQSAMSMLSFYLNRSGKNLAAKQRRVLQKAKQELRAVFGRK